MTEKTCTRCHTTKPLDEFSNSETGKYGKKSRCKICMRAIDRASRIPKKKTTNHTIWQQPTTHRVISGFLSPVMGSLERNR